MANSPNNDLIRCLQNTFSPNEQERKAAEAQLKQADAAPGYPAALMQIVVAGDVHVSIKQAAAIHLKSLTWSHWSAELERGAFILADGDKQFIKANVVEAVIHSPPLIRTQLALCMENVVMADFPDRWPELLPKLLSYLTSRDLTVTLGALEALHVLVHKYEFIPPGKKRRSPLHAVVDSTFPLLLQLFQSLAAVVTVESAQMQHVIIRIFSSATQMGVPPHLMQQQVFMAWMTIMLQVLTRPVPTQGQPEDADERKKWPFWKCKKWSARAFTRLFQRYGDPKNVDNASDKQFSIAFYETYSVKLLEAFLAVLSERRGGGGYLPDKLCQQALQYVSTAVRAPNTYTAIKPHFDAFFREVVFPIMCLTPEDLELWEDDPVEYIRRESDVVEEYYNPRTEAINVLVDITSLRSKNHLGPIMQFIVSILMRYLQTPPAQRNVREKDGALQVIGHLCRRLYKQKEYKGALESTMVAHVLPEFQNSHGFLRARACWIFAEYYEIDYANPAHFLAGLSATLNCLHDSQLPVRVQAGLAIRHLVRTDAGKAEFGKVLPQLFQEFLKMMNEVEHDELVSGLEGLIDAFQDSIGPYAVGLCSQLTDVFVRSASADEESETSAVAASECLNTIQTILGGLQEHGPLWAQVEVVLLPLLHKIFEGDFMDFFDEGVKILTYLTYYSPAISPQLWELFPKLYQAFQNFAFDYLNDLLYPIDNYITRGTATFLGGPYLEFVLNIFRKVYTHEHADFEAVRDGTEIVQVVLQACRGHVDPVVDIVLSLAIPKLADSDEVDRRVILIELVANCIYYNPLLTLRLLESRGWLAPTFTLWLQLQNKFEKYKTQKIVLLALSALFGVPSAELPAPIRDGLKPIFGAILAIQKAALKKSEEEESEESDEEHSEEDIDLDDEDEAEQAKRISEYKENLKKVKEFHGHDDSDNSDDEFDGYGFGEDDDGDVSSALDSVDEVIYFIEQFKVFSQREPALYQQMTADFTVQAELHNLSIKAMERQKEREQEAMEKAQQQ
eukprot:TRINITY_DN793_c0_g3_i2.p1 TRINITY_DN793_c0_g3~~TRINITY_DN793_c0_g3_i2.p1  ORF type:complete len:1027 (+),score=443.06 TRINITY_DN793_c0_g3_i2:37-3081(+)